MAAYGTWYQNDESKLGLVHGTSGEPTAGSTTRMARLQFLDLVKYDSKVLTLSGEVGYAFRPKEGSDWILGAPRSNSSTSARQR